MDLATAITFRDAAKAAYLQALDARAVSYADKTVSRQAITDLRREYDSWCRTVATLQRQAIGAGSPSAAIARWTR